MGNPEGDSTLGSFTRKADEYGEEDRQLWKNGLGGQFSVKACYDHLAIVEETLWPWEMVWYKAIPLKVQFFFWTTVLDKISTLDMLQKKGFILPSVCLLCYNDEKSTSHLLLHCPFAWKIWCGCAKDFGINFIVPRSLMDLLQGWNLKAFNCFGRKLWKVVPDAVCWAI